MDQSESPGKQEFYLDLVDYFFDDDDLHFRAVVVPDKALLNHAQFGQNHDDWYYKMYFTLLKVVFEPTCQYRVYIDIKDTLGHEKVAKLHDVLCHNAYDFSRKMIQRVQRVQSHEVEQLQLTDLLIGALSYLHRGLSTNSAKLALIERIKNRSGYKLTLNTMLRENKFNLIIWARKRSILMTVNWLPPLSLWKIMEVIGNTIFGGVCSVCC